MNVLILILPLALLIASIFLVGFILSVKSGQFDDLDTPAYRMLLNDEKIKEDKTNKQ